MARLFDDALTESLSINQAVLNAVPLAMACFFKSDDLTVGQSLISLADTDGDSQIFMLSARGDQANDYVWAQVDGDGGWGSAVTTGAYSANTWHHAAGVFVSLIDRRAFIDGGNKGTDNTNTTPTPGTFDITSIGGLIRLNPTLFMSGHIAEAAIWDLSVWPGENDIARANNFEKILPSLAKGFSPLFFPLGLKAYWPLIRDANDRVGGYNLE